MFLAVLGCSVAWAQGARNEIRVAGSGIVQVQPDQVCVNFSVRAEHREMAVARQQAAEKMTAILAAIRGVKAEGMIISTQSFQVRPVLKPLKKDDDPYAHGPEAEIARETIGYSVSNSVGVEVNGPPEQVVPVISRVIDVAVRHGATNVSNPQFLKVDTGSAYREALEKATRDAMQNAEALARGLGVKISSYRYVGMFPEPGMEEYYGPGIAYLSSGRGGNDMGGPGAPGGPGGGPPTPVEAKTIVVDAQVYVTAVYQ